MLTTLDRGNGLSAHITPGRGRPLFGPYAIPEGSPRFLAVFAEARGYALALFSADAAVTAQAALPGRPNAVCVSGRRIVVALASGGLAAYELDDRLPEPALAQLWRKEGEVVELLLPLPGDRAAAVGSAGKLASVDLAGGAELWSTELGALPADLAYASGIVVGCGAEGLFARSDQDGSLVWKSEALQVEESGAGAAFAVLASGGGIAASVDERGALYVYDASGGKLLSRPAGRYDPALRPVIDGGSVYAALLGGGGRQLDAKSGEALRNWSWPRPGAFLALDEARLYASSGSTLILRDRYAETSESASAGDLELGATITGRLCAAADGSALAFGLASGIAVAAGAEAGLAAASIEGPVPETAVEEAILAALKGFGGLGLEPGPPIHGAFASGTPVYPGDGLLVMAYEAAAKGPKTLVASPDPGDAVLAVFDAAGRLLACNVGELGSPGRLACAFEAGSRYWIAAWAKRPEGRYRMLLR